MLGAVLLGREGVSQQLRGGRFAAGLEAVLGPALPAGRRADEAAEGTEQWTGLRAGGLG